MKRALVVESTVEGAQKTFVYQSSTDDDSVLLAEGQPVLAQHNGTLVTILPSIEVLDMRNPPYPVWILHLRMNHDHSCTEG